MDIFTPSELDKQAKILIAANTLIQFNKDTIENLIQNHKTAFDMVWNNPDCTPQEILNVFGNNAYKLFVSSSKIQTLLAEIKPDYQPLIPPKEYQINEDGTVTIPEESSSESSSSGE